MYFDNVDLANRQTEIIDLFFALMNSTCCGFHSAHWFQEFYTNHMNQIPNGLDSSYTHQGCSTCVPILYPLAPEGIANSDPDVFWPQFTNWTTLVDDPVAAAASS